METQTGKQSQGNDQRQPKQGHQPKQTQKKRNIRPPTKAQNEIQSQKHTRHEPTHTTETNPNQTAKKNLKRN